VSVNALEAGALNAPAPDSATLRSRISTVHSVVTDFGKGYPNVSTSQTHTRKLLLFFQSAGWPLPADLTRPDLLRYVTLPIAANAPHGAGSPPANNTVRQRIGTIRAFSTWAVETGHMPTDLGTCLIPLMKQYPKTHGKVQSRHPARWLAREEVDQLLASCSDGTWLGSRDQLLIRLGILGVRRAELQALSFGHLQADGRLHWIGKGRRPRTVSPGPALAAMLDRWSGFATHSLGRLPLPGDPLLTSFAWDGSVTTWRRISRDAIGKVVAHRSQVAGLGHVAPHDLRRTGAGLLENDLTPDGGHRYSLVEIQKHLDHADPSTTMRCYISPLNTGVKDRAGQLLD
jgi:integrase